MDENTREAAGESLLSQLPDQPAPIIIKPAAGWKYATPHMDIATSLLKKEVSCDAIIAVGSGTINDLAKYASYTLDVPYLVVATAPSMNGYTSSVAALIKDGLKMTIPCIPPVAVLAGVDVLARAPAELLKSGCADLLSTFLATSDWRLANLVVDQTFSHLPGWIAHSAIDSGLIHFSAIPGAPAEPPLHGERRFQEIPWQEGAHMLFNRILGSESLLGGCACMGCEAGIIQPVHAAIRGWQSALKSAFYRSPSQ